MIKLTKNKYDKHETITTTEFRSPDMGQAHKQCFCEDFGLANIRLISGRNLVFVVRLLG